MPHRDPSTRSFIGLAAGDLGVAFLSGTFLALSLAPFGQFYLAFFGIVPLLWRIQSIPTTRRSALLGFLAGVVYFAIGFHWLFFATTGGYLVVCVIMSLYWMLAGALFHRIRSWKPVIHILAVAIIWAACDYLRSTVLGGFPWLQTGHSQSSLLWMCQIADITGVYGITAWIALVNTTLYRLYTDRKNAARGLALTAAITIAILIYGFLRIDNPQPSAPEIRIALVQSNHIHTPDGEKTVTQEQQIAYLIEHSRSIDADIIAWPETTMPALNIEVRTEPGMGAAKFLNATLAQISALALDRKASVVTGGYFVGGFKGDIGKRKATDIRNSVYHISSDGELAGRYDKIRLVPFAEYLPFQETESWLQRFLTKFATASYAAGYHLTPATDRTVFRNGTARIDSAPSETPVRFVTPICFEDTIAPLTASFFRPAQGETLKRADLILNISNDGWFNSLEKAQHLQIAIFRSIENRAPTARVSNTGQSAFIDSAGRVIRKLDAFSEGVLTGRVMIDPRLTFYTRFGDVFAWACVAGSAMVLLAALGKKSKREDARSSKEEAK